MKVAVFVDAYLPGFKAGGPIVSVSRIIEQDATNTFQVITRDRDLGESSAYPGGNKKQWQSVGRAIVAYLRPGLRDLLWITRQLRQDPPNVYYFNSLQSPWYTLMPLIGIKTRILPRRDVIIAPRGEASIGAQKLKTLKKSFWRPLIKWLIGTQVTWHVSSVLEKADILDWWSNPLPSQHEIVVWSDLPVAPAIHESLGCLSDIPIIVFASRIDRMKGLLEAIEILSLVKSPFQFQIYGDITDAAYWRECIEAAQTTLPQDSWCYKGIFQPNEATLIFSNASLFIFPTHGENFGHVIAEALSVGCPVVLTEHTHWTSVIQEGGGAIINSHEASAEFVSWMTQANISQIKERREKTLAVYRKWFRELLPQDFTCLTQDKFEKLR